MNETLNYNLLFEIDGFKNYFVGTDGVYSEKWGYMKKLKEGINSCGYYTVCFHKDSKQYTKKVHRLIAKMFIPNPDNLPQVDHINRNKIDNRLENLRWVSHRDNDRNRGICIRNTSGKQGVSFDKTHNSWAAHWSDNQGKLKRKPFSVKKYGDTQAKQLAIDYRKKMVDIFYNRV